MGDQGTGNESAITPSVRQAQIPQMSITPVEDPPNTGTSTEWLLRFADSGSGLHTAVVYRTRYALDEEGESTGLQRLWVAARGYEGRVFGEHSAVASFEDDEVTIARCHAAGFEESEDIENVEMVTEEDLRILAELWEKIGELSSYDPDLDEGGFISNLPREGNDDFISSEGWEADDLLEPISDGWQLFLKF
jgi:hypothetical protein